LTIQAISHYPPPPFGAGVAEVVPLLRVVGMVGRDVFITEAEVGGQVVKVMTGGSVLAIREA